MSKVKLVGVGLAAVAALTAGRHGNASIITVGNASFESPTTASFTRFGVDASGVFGNWEVATNTAVGSEFTGILNNGAFGKYTNATGSQTGDIGASPTGTGGSTLGIFQDTTSYSAATQNPNNLWSLGMTYTMTVDVGSRADSPVLAGNALDLRLFYRPADQGPVGILSDIPVVAGTTAGLNTATLTAYSVTFTPQAGDPELGLPIDIWLVPSVVKGNNQGDWVVDNVQLSSVAAVPEPVSVGLIGIAGLLAVRRRRR